MRVFNFEQTPSASLANIYKIGRRQCPPQCPQRPIQGPGWKTPAGVSFPEPLCEGKAHPGSLENET
jgi:hypothetical protein